MKVDMKLGSVCSRSGWSNFTATSLRDCRSNPFQTSPVLPRPSSLRNSYFPRRDGFVLIIFPFTQKNFHPIITIPNFRQVFKFIRLFSYEMLPFSCIIGLLEIYIRRKQVRFSLQDVKKQVQRRGSELYVGLHFLRPGELRTEIEGLIAYYEQLIGQPRQQFSMDDARACIGDYRLAHCLVSTLNAWYHWRQGNWSEVLERIESEAHSCLDEAGI